MSRDDPYLAIRPFAYLRADARRWLRDHVERMDVLEGTVIIEQHCDDRAVYLLTEGLVETRDDTVEPSRHIDFIEPGHYFGERAALFGAPRTFQIRAAKPSTVWKVEGDDFLALIRNEPTFSSALSHILRDKHGVLVPVDHLLALLQHGVANYHLTIKDVLPVYRRLRPALHPGAAHDEIDFVGLSYAVRRLPENVTRTFCFYLTDDLHLWRPFAGGAFAKVETAARRRAVYEMLAGKSLVLLRDSLSDLTDFVTCLSVFATEAKKIRHRVRSATVLLSMCEEAHPSAQQLHELPFSPAERQELQRIWPGQVVDRVRDIAVHHEDFDLQIHLREQDNYNSGHAEVWSRQIAEAAEGLLGVEPHELAEDLEVHVISSNTHSVANCLGGWLHDHREQVLAWGRSALPELAGLPWTNELDLAIACSREFREAHPDVVDAEEVGRAVVRDGALTGIAVELYDTTAMDRSRIEPDLPRPHRRQLIVNIDYAFGQQALVVMHQLVALFGHRLRSVNILGKAGGLVGRRGDVLIPTGFVEQLTDVLHRLDNAADTTRIQARLPQRGVHVGPVLTVVGTLVQNRTLLRYYERLWQAVGLEMEGSWYYRELVQSMLRGLLGDDCVFRALYYVSDLPLSHEENLSASLGAFEGIPPLYAATREVLTGIFEG